MLGLGGGFFKYPDKKLNDAEYVGLRPNSALMSDIASCPVTGNVMFVSFMYSVFIYVLTLAKPNIRNNCI